MNQSWRYNQRRSVSHSGSPRHFNSYKKHFAQDRRPFQAHRDFTNRSRSHSRSQSQRGGHFRRESRAQQQFKSPGTPPSKRMQKSKHFLGGEEEKEQMKRIQGSIEEALGSQNVWMLIDEPYFSHKDRAILKSFSLGLKRYLKDPYFREMLKTMPHMAESCEEEIEIKRGRFSLIIKLNLLNGDFDLLSYQQ